MDKKITSQLRWFNFTRKALKLYFKKSLKDVIIKGENYFNILYRVNFLTRPPLQQKRVNETFYM